MSAVLALQRAIATSEADIVLLRTDRLNITPLNDPATAIVVGMDTSNVATGGCNMWTGRPCAA